MSLESEKNYLWKSFKEGDKKSFQAIYNDHFEHLSNYGFRLSKNKELVQDAIHDLFVKLWNNKTNLADVTSIRSYLLVALRSVILNKMRQSTRLKLYEDMEEIPFEMEFSVESDFINRETDRHEAKRLVNALNRLTPRQKEVLYLRYYIGMNYNEIASVLNVSLKATYKLSARAIEALRNILDMPASAIVGLLPLFISVQHF